MNNKHEVIAYIEEEKFGCACPVFKGALVKCRYDELQYLVVCSKTDIWDKDAVLCSDDKRWFAHELVFIRNIPDNE